MVRKGTWLWRYGVGCLILATVQAQLYPPVPLAPPDPSQGLHLQRTVSLLRQSQENRRHTVRILSYGSITRDNSWFELLKGFLRTEYPSAQLVCEERSIPFHYSHHARKTAESDVYPFLPDLVILAGAASFYDLTNLVRSIRERTAAEVLVPTDFFGTYDQLDEERSPRALNELARQGRIGSSNNAAWWSYSLIPSASRELGYAVADIRTRWRQYLVDNQLSITNLVPDWHEPGPHGQFVFAELLKPHLLPVSGLPARDPWDNDRVSTYTVGRDVTWREGKLVLDFKGYRVDVIAAEGQPEEADVRIDGAAPSRIPGLQYFTRANGVDPIPNPLLLRAGSMTPPRDGELWTITLRDVGPDGRKFRFTVAGSVTGADGEGTSEFEFVSKSGRLVIAPDDWNVAWCSRLLGGPVADGTEVRLESRLLGVDRYIPGPPAEAGVETVTTLASGLSNGPHRLELAATGGGPPPLRAIRVYRAPLQPLPPPSAKKGRR